MWLTIVDNDIPTLQCQPDDGRTIILDDTGEISQAGEVDEWEIQLDPYRLYLIEILGADNGLDIMNEDTHEGDLTLADPELLRMRSGDGQTEGGNYTLAVRDGGKGRNSITVARRTGPSSAIFELTGKDGATGTYQIKIRINDYCITRDGEAAYPYFGGPEGYRLDVADDASTESNLRNGSTNTHSTQGFIGDDWYTNDDHDWHQVTLEKDRTYTFTLSASAGHQEKHRLADPRIVGLFDADGQAIAGTASTGTGATVTVTYTAAASGVHYVSVAAREAGSTGVYRLLME